jgi:cation diffusion facilitator family transporter
MLAETYHSISDTGNQVFLLIGIFYGRREADESHPFGYGKAEFFYSFLVSVFLFGIAGWESAKHGYEAIRHGETSVVEGTETIPLIDITLKGVYINYGILLGAIVFESYALMKARAGMKKEMEKQGYDGYVEAFRKTSQTTILTALTEDTIALVGLGLALLGIFLSRATGNPMFDAATALLIGIMLMGFAIALALENKRLLIGESLQPDDEEELRRIVRETEGVATIRDFRTVYFGPGSVIVTGDVAFEKNLGTQTIANRITTMQEEIRSANPSVSRVYLEVEGPRDATE